MPTYRYLCSKCGEEFDVIQPITDPALTTHDGCGGKLQKVFGSVGIVFKGSGFHKTDSRKAATASQAASESKSEKSDKSEKSEKKDNATNENPASSEKKDSGPKETPST